MIITRTFDINDEPMVSASTGKRSAEIKYYGGRYVYAELCNCSKKILIMVHSSENPEMNIALERLTPNEDRTIIEIDATENILAASIISDNYELSVEDYVEKLPNGETFEYEYPKPTKLLDIFDIHNMTYNKDEKDFYEYKFIINDIPLSEFKEGINMIISNTKESLSTNEYSTSDKATINDFLTTLDQILKDVDQGIPHWKIKFPVCNIIK